MPRYPWPAWNPGPESGQTAPPCRPTGRERQGPFLPGDLQICHPGKPHFFALVVNLPILQQVDLKVLVGLVQGQTIDETEAVIFLRIPGISHDELRSLTRLHRGIGLLEQKLMVTGLDTKNETQVQRLEFSYMWGVAAQGVFGDDDRKMGVFVAELPPETLRGIPLTILLVAAVLLADHLGTEGNDLPFVRVDNGCSIHLLVVGGFTVFPFFLRQKSLPTFAE